MNDQDYVTTAEFHNIYFPSNRKGNPFRCVSCNLFISTDNARIYSFTPDTPFTSEKTEYICASCKEKEKTGELV